MQEVLAVKALDHGSIVETVQNSVSRLKNVKHLTDPPATLGYTYKVSKWDEPSKAKFSKTCQVDSDASDDGSKIQPTPEHTTPQNNVKQSVDPPALQLHFGSTQLEGKGQVGSDKSEHGSIVHSSRKCTTVLETESRQRIVARDFKSNQIDKSQFKSAKLSRECDAQSARLKLPINHADRKILEHDSSTLSISKHTMSLKLAQDVTNKFCNSKKSADPPAGPVHPSASSAQLKESKSNLSKVSCLKSAKEKSKFVTRLAVYRDGSKHGSDIQSNSKFVSSINQMNDCTIKLQKGQDSLAVKVKDLSTDIDLLKSNFSKEIQTNCENTLHKLEQCDLASKVEDQSVK